MEQPGAELPGGPDPTAAFLAMEQELLGADAALFQGAATASVLGTVDGALAALALGDPVPSPTAGAVGDGMSSAVPFLVGGLAATGTTFPATATTATSNGNGNASLPFASPALSLTGGLVDMAPESLGAGLMDLSPSTAAAPPPMREGEEPEAIRKWRIEFAERVRERDAASVAKKERILRDAQEATERFYAEYAEKKAATARREGEGEAALVASSSSAAGVIKAEPNFWRRVYKHIEPTPKEQREVVNLKGGKGGASTPSAGGPGGSTTTSSSARDTTRLKGLLQELKSDQRAPCLEA